MTAAEAAARIARDAYGRLLAMVAGRTRDITAAEDALADAFVAALTRWPIDGVPDNPDAWLLSAARRRAVDQFRRAAVRDRARDYLQTVVEELGERGGEGPVPDERLQMLFVCTHPAIAEEAQVPLMLQTVLGLDAEAIASAFRVAPKTMGQRLWRAKTKIRNAGIPFEVPGPDELPARLDRVLEAIYAAFGVAWEDHHGMDARARALTDEAIFIGRLLVTLLPDEPEARGLLALMLFADARTAARRDAHGGFVPLAAQDPTRWDTSRIDEAERHLRAAFARGRIGPYQLEAALQSAHVAGIRTGRVDHAAILELYTGLVALAPSLGAAVGHAAALIEVHGGDAALRALDELPASMTRDYQPYFVVRAEALRATGRLAEAAHAYDQAIGLTEDPAIRAFLQARRGACA
ncbi:MAG: DUF6596 domain-containing protein [Kofleriaceae bacterium]|nr:DUF6596 domain-containing protein [Kofleriaceae bacterium]